ncbi:MAG: MotA/TolQ/ExbB proton channel family protein, partial [Gammaproteobacteria bacterium]|nr:MotA/TolQ/ExbB proton channel family protein [Gammaproteobacteria bacterium]
PGLSLAPGTGLSIPSAPSLTVAAQTGFTLTMWLRPGASGSSAAAGNAAASFGAGPGEAPVAAGNVAAGSDSGSSSAGASTATTDVGSDSATTPGSAGSEMVLRMVAPGEPLLFRASDGSSQLSLSAGADGLQLALRSPALPEPLRLAPVPLTSGAWQHVAVVLSAERLTLYLNGREGSSAALGADGAGLGFQAALQIGGGAFAGQIDELSLSGKARSADWLAFNASNQGPQDVLLSYGTDQSPQSAGGGAHASNFGIIFQSVFGNPEAIVEQSVIILCALMATIALLVMFFKWLFLMRAQGASRRFARAFQKLHAEQHVGDDTQRPVLEGLYESRRRFADSPLFRVYRIGIDEVRSRMGSTVGAQAAGLDGKALTSVRAAMDSAMVRERQRMDSQMVLLTIAISGGPFIGLLGTVVGVMVTFAAIAQAGDVNITAIAPGMAAALLATVAGLGVAIPALFGYNYLGSRIKDLSADMHVFADELLSRINEIYGR